MNDSEIIKGLECCYKTFECETCPYNREDNKRMYMGSPECKGVSIKDVVDLINRQRAEIDRLNIDLKAMRGAANSWKAEVQRICKKEFDNIEIDVETVKSEAVREFAEKLKEHSCNLTEYDEGGWSDTVSAVKVEDIDRLVGEMGCDDE